MTVRIHPSWYTALTPEFEKPYWNELTGFVKEEYATSTCFPEGKNIYEITLKNNGGLVSPVIIEWTFKDGSKEIERLPAEIWRDNEQEIKKIFVKEKEVTHVVIDPNAETADTNLKDNVFPKKITKSRFDQLKKRN